MYQQWAGRQGGSFLTILSTLVSLESAIQSVDDVLLPVGIYGRRDYKYRYEEAWALAMAV